MGRRHGRGALPCFVCTPRGRPRRRGRRVRPSALPLQHRPRTCCCGQRQAAEQPGRAVVRTACGGVFPKGCGENHAHLCAPAHRPLEQAVAHEQRAGCRRLASAPAHCQRERRRGTGHTGARGLSCRDRSAIVLWLCARLLWLARPRGNEGKATSDASFVTARAGLVGCATV